MTLEEPVEGTGPLRVDFHTAAPGPQGAFFTMHLVPIDPLPDRDVLRLELPLEVLEPTKDALDRAARGLLTKRDHFEVAVPVRGGWALAVAVRAHPPGSCFYPGVFRVEMRPMGPHDLTDLGGLVFPLEALEPAIKVLSLAVEIEGRIDLAWSVEDL